MAKNQSHPVFCTLIVFLLLGASVKSRDVPQESEMVKMHEEWMIKHGRVYVSPEEKEYRFKVFKENVELINPHNQVEGRTYDKAVNKFSDMTFEEFKAKYFGSAKGSQARPRKGSYMKPALKHKDVPASVDWRKKGAVTPVKDTGDCSEGSYKAGQGVWAFAAVATVEAIHKFKGPDHKLISLSAQELIDCLDDSDFGDLDEAYIWIKYSGINTEEAYPYRSCRGECNEKASSFKAVTISNFSSVPTSDEKALEQIVAQQPVSVLIQVGNDIRQYGGGIYPGKCEQPLLGELAVAIVGYGSENGTSYWIIKNAWGVDWGEEGYLRMEKDVPTTEESCQLIYDAWYPIIE